MLNQNFTATTDDAQPRHLWDAFVEVSRLLVENEVADLFASLVDEISAMQARDNNVRFRSFVSVALKYVSVLCYWWQDFVLILKLRAYFALFQFSCASSFHSLSCISSRVQ